MKSLRTYAIPYTGLKLGKHRFDFEVTDAFFDEFEYSLVKKAGLECVVDLEKQETLIILNFHIKGAIGMNCDRCLSALPFDVDIHEQQIAKFSDDEADDEDIIMLSKNDHEINIAGLVYEYINVAAPLIAVCSDKGNTPYCDMEMLDRLEKLSAGEEQEEQPDPRWDVLKKIK